MMRRVHSAASVRQRLLNLARDRGDDFQLVLMRYAAERLLFRLGQSAHASAFVLKGAMLFSLWSDLPHRSTLDVDLAGFVDPDRDHLLRIFRELCELPVAQDGLEFDAAGMVAEEVREGQEYGGVRLRLAAALGSARIPLQIDIGFGDAITPDAPWSDYPTLLDLPTPRLRTYPKETVLAEKLQVMTVLGIANSRMKDFYNLWVLVQGSAFEGRIVAAAVAATFDRRGTTVPASCPTALGLQFASDASKRAQWRAFMARGRLRGECPSLERVTGALAAFFEPVLAGLATGTEFNGRWPPGGPWRPV